MFDYIYKKLRAEYDKPVVYSSDFTLWRKFCTWFLFTFFVERMYLEKLEKTITWHRKEIAYWQKRHRVLMEVLLRHTGDFEVGETFGNGATESGHEAWLAEEYPPRAKRID